jgi:hypothetical protein
MAIIASVLIIILFYAIQTITGVDILHTYVWPLFSHLRYMR